MNTFGNKFRVSIFGESHGPRIGVTVDGVLPGIPISEEDFKADLARRKAGALGTTPRVEDDFPQIISGVYDGHTTGAPLTIVFRNENTRSQDYEQFRANPRPGHADFTANLKFGGFNDIRGGGHFSGRLTLGIVAAGVIAKKMLYFAKFHAQLVKVGGLADASAWPEALKAAQAEGDSLGGVVECTVEGLPIGLGEPFWNSVESMISHAVFAIPGVRGIEFGDGLSTSAGTMKAVSTTVAMKANQTTNVTMTNRATSVHVILSAAKNLTSAATEKATERANTTAAAATSTPSPL